MRAGNGPHLPDTAESVYRSRVDDKCRPLDHCLLPDDVYIAIAGPVALVIGGLFRWEGGLYALGHVGVWLALTLSGIRYRVTGFEHVPSTAVVFC